MEEVRQLTKGGGWGADEGKRNGERDQGMNLKRQEGGLLSPKCAMENWDKRRSKQKEITKY